MYFFRVEFFFRKGLEGEGVMKLGFIFIVGFRIIVDDREIFYCFIFNRFFFVCFRVGFFFLKEKLL